MEIEWRLHRVSTICWRCYRYEASYLNHLDGNAIEKHLNSEGRIENGMMVVVNGTYLSVILGGISSYDEVCAV